MEREDEYVVEGSKKGYNLDSIKQVVFLQNEKRVHHFHRLITDMNDSNE